jgi:hypothetical protein
MSDEAAMALHQWMRYQFVRDNGHADFVKKADRCNNFFIGRQWDAGDMALLRSQKRPALTINKIISTISNVLGSQIEQRSDISFQPRSGAPVETATTLTKVFRQISDNNQLEWQRSDMFCDGIISSRGFLDTRLDFTDSMSGEVKIARLNPKNVLIDPDAEEYDPDTWNDVITTKWVTWQDIELLYGKEKAMYLKNRGDSFFAYGYDSIERDRDRFGYSHNNGYYGGPWDDSGVMRNIRVIERQYKKLDKQLHFVDLKTGDMRPIPEAWDKAKIAMVQQHYGLGTITKLTKRIRWVVTADNIVLHDDWSPYKYYTVVPYFPYFRHGTTVGLVENLLDPQEYLNKVTSQELHVINTTANSGWIVSTGRLLNMSVEELEHRGAETGLVAEVEGDASTALVKIQPNQTPSGLDRFSYKAEEHIKGISGVTDYQTGNAREDVSAKAVAMNQSSGLLNNAKPMDSMLRTDFILARNILAMVQEFYSEPRIMNITANRITGESEEVRVNQPDPETGAITNDLTVGEYDVIVSNTPTRETLEDSQFEQAVAMRELGVRLPDETLIENSRLNKRGDIIKTMREEKESAEAQAATELAKLQAEAELAKSQADAARIEADALLKQAKAAETQATTAQIGQPDPNELMTARLDQEKSQQQMEMDRMKAAQQMQEQQQKAAQDLRMNAVKAQQEAEQREEEMRLKLQELELKLKENEALHEQKMKHLAETHTLALKNQKAQAAAKPKPTKAKPK